MPVPTTTDLPATPVPRVVVAMVHPTMRRHVCDLIEHGCRCWLATTTPGPEHLRDVVTRLHPDVVVLESSRFPACCPDMRDVFPVDHVVVVGPYPDDAYRNAAMAAGAGAWISRDRLPVELIHELCRITEMATCTCGCQDRSPSAPPSAPPGG